MDARANRKPHPMPEIADFVSQVREAFGDRAIDEGVRRGKAGEPSFYACENGRAVGTATPSGPAWKVDDPLHDHRFCAGCSGDCVGQDVRCCSRRARGLPQGIVNDSSGQRTSYRRQQPP